MSDALITVPTYWTWKDGKAHVGDVPYDHPTPLNQEGTLARLLESLRTIDGPEFKVVIITAVTDLSLGKLAEIRVEEIIDPFKDSFPIVQFAGSDLALLQELLARLGFQQKLVSLQGYGNVRNIQLIVAQAMGAEVVVGLDDDEVIADRDYLKKAVEFAGKTWKGKSVDGVAGFYLDSHGRTKVREKSGETEAENVFRRKAAIMNAATEAVERHHGRLVETSFVYGGNMVIHRRMFEEIPFDPYIPRGEDIDYLINGRLKGYHFFFDKELAITHLPPPAGPHLREDIVRFIYEREKLRMARGQPGLKEVLPESLDPYPGAFLGEDLEEQAREVLRECEWPEEIVEEAAQFAREMVPRYFELYNDWPHLMESVREASMLQEMLAQKFERRKPKWS